MSDRYKIVFEEPDGTYWICVNNGRWFGRCTRLEDAELILAALNAQQAPPAAAVPEGYALVPVEPTTAMKCRAVEAWEGPSVYKNIFARGLADLEDKAAECWDAMLAAALAERNNTGDNP